MEPSNRSLISEGMSCASQTLPLDLQCDPLLYCQQLPSDDEGSYDDFDLHNDACMTDMDDDDHDQEDFSYFPVSYDADSMTLKGHTLPPPLGVGFSTGGQATMSAA